MSLRWHRFESAARPAMRRAVAASGNLKKQRRAARRARWRWIETPGWVWKLVFLLMAAQWLFARIDHPRWIMAAGGLWLTGLLLIRTGDLSHALCDSAQLHVFAHLPIGNRAIFTHLFRVFLQRSLWSLLFLLVPAQVLLLGRGAAWETHVLAAAMCGLIWVLMVAAAVALMCFAPYSGYWRVGSGFILAGVAMGFFGPGSDKVADLIAQPMLVFPGLSLLANLLLPGAPQGVAPVISSVGFGLAALVLGPLAYHKLKAAYNPGEEWFAAAGLAQSSVQGHAAPPAEWSSAFTRDPGEAADRIRQPEIMAGLDWPRLGLIERLAARFLSPRERYLAEYLTAGSPTWTGGLKFSMVTLAIAIALLYFFPPLLKNLGGMVLFVAISVVLPGLMGGWNGTGSPAAPGLASPCFATLPIGFWPMAWVMIKVNLLRLLSGAPLLLAGWFLLPISRGDYAWVGPKILFIGFCLVPCAAILSISPGTNDSKRTALVIPIGFLFILLLAAGLVFFLAPNLIAVFAASAALVVVPIAILAVYGRAFNRGRVDLVPLARNRS